LDVAIDEAGMTTEEKLTMALEALDFYSKQDRYVAKNRKTKPRIIVDSGAIARRTLIKIIEGLYETTL